MERLTVDGPPPLAETLDPRTPPPQEVAPSAAALIEEFESEAATRPLKGRTALVATTLAVGIACYALYWVVAIVETQLYRTSFLLVALALTFIVYPARRATRTRVTAVDWALVALAVVALGWPIVDLAQFSYRAATPTPADLVLGVVTILIVLEATRRTVGWVLPATALAFLLYAYLGPLFDLVGLGWIAHRGYYLDRLVGALYMTLEGIFGVPLDVASTYIVLFGIFGAVLEASGAGQFFIDWAMAAMGRTASGSAPGRAVTTAGFLLGTVSGSGVATTVTLGSVSWPLLRRSGYPAEVGGAILAAAGIGAILSPPTLGAAAFLIAEFLNIPYVQVLVMATLPTVLYYLSAALMIEADSRRLGTHAVRTHSLSLGRLTITYGYHFLPLVAITVMLAVGMSAFRAVLWATVLAFLLSFLRRESALGPRRLVRALESGGRSVLSVAATTATAGIIVGVVTLTGLGLKLAGLIVALAGGSLVLTVIYSALAVLVLGLAVPVTASYIIAAVMIAPALAQVGVAPLAAHMFIFYYAVLSEVSPPTAMSPFAAAALTGGNAFRTMMLTWKYTLPAFVVPFVFTLDPSGMGLLMQAPLATVVWTMLTAAAGVAAFAAAFGGWIRRAATAPERIGAGIAGVLLIAPSVGADVAGGIVALIVGLVHVARVKTTLPAR